MAIIFHFFAQSALKSIMVPHGKRMIQKVIISQDLKIKQLILQQKASAQSKVVDPSKILVYLLLYC